MPRDEYGRDPRRHEGGGCDKRSYRQPREPADAVPGGAAIAPHRAEADKEAGERKNAAVGLNSLGWQFSRDDQQDQRRRDQSSDKSKATTQFTIRVRWKQAGRDAADAGNSPGEPHQHHRGETNGSASRKRGDRSEGGRNIDHQRSPTMQLYF